jgi:hypothetical protein
VRCGANGYTTILKLFCKILGFLVDMRMLGKTNLEIMSDWRGELKLPSEQVRIFARNLCNFSKMRKIEKHKHTLSL